MTATIHHGDCLDVLRGMPDNSVDAICCDPPYGLSNTSPDKVTETIVRWAQGDREYVPTGKGFMSQTWDAFVPPVAVWDECLRVLKPGGHLVAFAGSRTQDLMGIAIRLAGFDIRENLAWLYGSGFPKSMDVSKAIDKARNEDKEPRVAVTSWTRDQCESLGWTRKRLCEAYGVVNEPIQSWTERNPKRAVVPTWENWQKLKNLVGFSDEMDDEVWRLNGNKGKPGANWDKREVVGERETKFLVRSREDGTRAQGDQLMAGERNVGVIRDTLPASEDAQRWQGWGTATKPAHEPVILARKPLSEKTVAANTLTWGTGGLNIDKTRIGTQPAGRWPANVVLDPDTAKVLDQQSGTSKSVQVNTRRGGILRFHGFHNLEDLTAAAEAGGKCPDGRDAKETLARYWAEERTWRGYTDEGGASRFFKVVEPDPPFMYAAKAPKRERPRYEDEQGNVIQHPTCKPLSIMKWLSVLVCPPGGTILDPFAGSGTTVEAAMLEGFNVIGIEREAEYLPLIQQRIDRANDQLPLAS